MNLVAIVASALLLMLVLDLGSSGPADVPGPHAAARAIANQARTPSRAAAPPDRGSRSAPAAPSPAPPQATVDTAYPKPSGRTLRVPAGQDLQAALDQAKPGDVIALEPRATYRGPFRLRPKNGSGWVVITSAAASLPPPGTRVEPRHASLMPRLVASSGPVFLTESGAHHYRFVGLEIAPEEGTFLTTLVELGNEETSAERLPHHLVFDRCYLHGDRTRGARRGIAMNARHTAVIDSYLADFKELGADTQALAAWNGAGPFRIANNYLEAAGENVMFGGADPAIPGLVPADIEVVGNHFAKPLRWKADDESFEGVEWTVKNLLELKNARRVRIEGNLFEYNWPQAQNGFAILFTVRNQEGDAPWSVIEDVTFANNLVRHVAAGINVLGRDDNHPSGQTQRIAIRNNVFLDVGGRWKNGRLFQLLNGTSSVAIDHNTAFQTGSLLVAGDSAPHTGFVFQNNVAPHNDHGITGSGTDAGVATLQRYFPDAVVRRNVIVGGNAAQYPRDNFFPSSFDTLGRLSTRRDAFRLSLASPYAGAATDGRDPGADVAAISRALGATVAVGLRAEEARNSHFPAAQREEDSGDDPASAQALTPGTVRGVSLGIFAVSLLLLAYVYVGYPLIAAARAALRPRPRRTAPITPFVSVVVVAHNEEDRICAKIENLLALDYPADRLEIVIASDGSTDGTADRARRYEPLGVRICAFGERRGKAAVINAVVPLLRAEIVVFADARQRFDAGSVAALVANFADPAVGAVSGELVLTAGSGTATASRGTALYWRYEKFIRSTEARSSSTVGATGAIYAIRRELFEPIPDDTLLDDVLIPVRIVRKGYRVLFEPRARAYDAASTTARQEFIRKARTSAGTFQLLARERWLLNPFTNPLWFETVSHKALRLALPVLHATVLASNVALAGVWPFGWLLAAQLVFYAAALAGYVQRSARRRSPLFSVPCAICLLCWATVVGFLRFLTNRQQVTWERGVSTGSVELASTPPASAEHTEVAPS